MQRRALIATPLAAPLLTRRAEAQGRTLTIGIGGAFSSMDPHYHDLSPNHALTQHIFEPLITTDADGIPIPCLATSWQALEPTLWEIKLRPNVTWHDGSPFTADDVLFTFQRAPNVPNSPASMGQYIRPLTNVTTPDPLTLHIRTAAPVPLVPRMLSSFVIVSRKHGEGMDTRDYNSGRAAVGTGPYKYVSFTPGDRALFDANPAYWGGVQPWSRVVYRMIPNDSGRVAALRAGDLDAIDNVPTRDVAAMRQVPGITVQTKVGQRLIYLYLDVARERSPFVTDLRGNPIPNPLRDVRVRRAITHAINREGIARQLMEGFARPTGQFVPEGGMGYDPTIPVPAFDPALSRRLLAEAGLPEGFAITLHAPNDRYVNDAEIAQALAQMWTRVGIRTAVNAMPSSVFFPRTPRDENSIALTGWSSNTAEPNTTLINQVATQMPERGWGTTRRASHYSNPETDAIIERALATIDPTERAELYKEAIRIGIMRDVATIPLHHQVNVWATRSHVSYAPRIWETTRAMEFRPA
ncbi:ABC transporter substrate-binding protein [Rhodovarius crocodyli]|uniref:ABC transporter substrate-binding protein n=1 Tax=Rhodovarius crocodyli TaxID=1979269 RepID=A0A437MPH6_9PROT|nr:ABC transporter substrate-binding protein [Rhodovarius crocodyli]RVT99525.1 ABC transporter substrate-binding protein [Rhodovarius crocodyli]